MMKFFFLLISILAFTSEITAKTASSGTYTSDRGFFSLVIPLTYQQNRILNSDGSFANFNGPGYGVGIDFKIWGNNQIEFRLFADYLNTQTTDKSTDDKLKTEETQGGLKIYPNLNLYFLGLVGRVNSTFQSSQSAEIKMTAPTTGLGVGYDFNLSESFALSTSLIYKSGPIKQNENSSFGRNSFLDSTQFSVGFVFRPPAVTVIVGR